MKNLTGIRKNGEDIVIRDRRSLRRARKIASRLSSSRNHSWANIWYRDSDGQIVEEAWYEGHLYLSGAVPAYGGKVYVSVKLPNQGKFWFSKFWTIEQAISSLQ